MPLTTLYSPSAYKLADKLL